MILCICKYILYNNIFFSKAIFIKYKKTKDLLICILVFLIHIHIIIGLNYKKCYYNFQNI